MHRTMAFRLTLAMAILAGWSSAKALINPNFTPPQLVEQAQTILKVTVKPTDKPLVFQMEVQTAYKPKDKGPAGAGKITLDLSTADEAAAKEVATWFAAPGRGDFALLFAGEFQDEKRDRGKKVPDAFLHFNGKWVDLFRAKDGASYQMAEIDLQAHMQGTWAGSTEMLDRCINYVLTDKSPHVPVTAEASWDRSSKCGNVPGKVTAAVAIDLGEGLRQSLFVASDGGDKLFTYDEKAKELVDVTAKQKLASKSLVSVWGCFDHSARISLASWDGKSLTLHLQQADGTFVAKPVDLGDALKGGCVSLTVIDCGKGQPGLLAGTPTNAVVLSPGGDSGFVATVLSVAAPTTQKDKQPSPSAGQCLVADFDGDSIADVLQLFGSYGLFYKGKGAGQFEKGVVVAACLGEGRAKAWLGDYEGDGSIDVFTVAEDRPRMWHNAGGANVNLKFVEATKFTGELAYIAQPGGIDGVTCDFNNDSRQDIMIVYGDKGPQFFFNRGFCSFGHGRDLEVDNLVEAAKDGLQAGCLGDFAGNGAQDLAMVLKNGEVHVCYRKVFEDEAALSIRVALPGNGAIVGPMTVTAYDGKRCQGSWTITAGSTWGFFGLRNGGSRTLKWQQPGGQPEQKEVKVIDQPMRVLIEPKKP
jgi:hypothetical protein